ncbi:gem (nuclear organelle) associated protein 2 [Coemansia sp. RSA 2049]|nr:gem (nuclear organelle) associated protein 2 [Coemansia sp. RSA 2049]
MGTTRKDDVASIQRHALPIPDNVTAGDLSMEPESGEQYMLRVRMEAVSMPSVSVAENRDQMLLMAARSKQTEHDPILLGHNEKSGEERPMAPGSVQPSEEWLTRFPAWFYGQRKRLMLVLEQTRVPDDFDLPGGGQMRKWKTFCYETSGHSETNRAILCTLASIDQAMAMRLIKWITSWVAVDKLQRSEGIWLWYLILRIDDLLDHDDTHALRELCRKLKRTRENIGNYSQNPESNLLLLQHRGDEIAAINILIASVTRGYRQRDLD